jgi:hypothetical protein
MIAEQTKGTTSRSSHPAKGDLSWNRSGKRHALVASDGTPVLEMLIEGDTAHVTSSRGFVRDVTVPELVIEANRLGLSSMTSEDVCPTLATVFRIHGRWVQFNRPADLVSYLDQRSFADRKLTADECLQLDVLAWQLPWEPVFAPIIQSNIFRWLERVSEAELAMTPRAAVATSYDQNPRLLFSIAGRLIWLAHHFPKPDPLQAVILRRALTIIYRVLCASAPSKTTIKEALALAQIMTRFPTFFTPRQRYSAALRSLHCDNHPIDASRSDELSPYAADWLRWFETHDFTKPGPLTDFLKSRLKTPIVGPLKGTSFAEDLLARLARARALA